MLFLSTTCLYRVGMKSTLVFIKTEGLFELDLTLINDYN